MSGRRRHLRNRLMLAFAGFTVVVATLFGFYVALFAYSVEDLFFARILDREAEVQLQHHARTGRWTQPHESFVAVVADASALPEDLPERLATEPRRREFAGAHGHHYHLRPLAIADPHATGMDGTAWLVAEVSGQLVIRPRRAGLFQWLAWSGVAVVALALLLGWWLARRTAAPLSRLASLVDRSQPAHLPTGFASTFPNDEVGVLARALERLIERVDDFISREREFTRDASHELRTPLAVIRGACEQLATDSTLSIAGRQHLDHVRQSARQLEQTVSTLLSLAREEQPSRAATATAILPILERVIVEQAPLLDGKPVEVDVRIDAQLARHARLTVPAPVLHILLSNLVGNAFAHTPQGCIRIDIDEGRLRIANPGGTVRDADFEAHVRGASSAGFGLGLAIVRRLCERHDIDLSIETRHDLNNGSEDDAATTIASLALDPRPGTAA